MTDPFPIIGGTFGWLDLNCPPTTSECEIADLCQLPLRDGTQLSQAQPFTGRDGRTYYRHRLWSQAAADVNPDRACTTLYPRSPQDVVWHSTKGYNEVYYDGDVVKPTKALGQSPLASSIVGVGDFDGDGYDDILFRTDLFITGSTTLTYWWRGQTTSPPPSTFHYTTLSGWAVAGIGDFDGDGVADILWRQNNADPGVIGIWYLGTGAGVNTGTIPAAAVPAIGDFDGDGKADLIWRTVTATSDTYAMWPKGVQPTTSTPVTGPGADFAIEGVGDFDADVHSDLYFRSKTTGQCVIWYSGQSTRTAQVGVIAPGLTIAAVGNFDADRKSDLYVYTPPPALQLFIYPGGLASGTPRSVGIINADAATLSVAGVGSLDF